MLLLLAFLGGRGGNDCRTITEFYINTGCPVWISTELFLSGYVNFFVVPYIVHCFTALFAWLAACQWNCSSLKLDMYK